jgi:glyoxylase-like metal-dependent hydrolase (beta-lactamase superfamily II)
VLSETGSSPTDSEVLPGQLREIAPGVNLLRMPLPFRLNHINLYLLEDSDGWTLVDCGLNRPEVLTLWQEVLAGGLGGKPITRIVVTHLHPDHIGLANALQRLTGAPVFMTRREWRLAQDVFNLPLTNAAWIERHYRRLGLEGESLQAVASQASGYRRLVKELPADIHYLHEHETLDIGGRHWRILFGSGHSPASACLWDESDRILIAGDHILPTITSNINLLSVGPTNPLDEYLTSLRTFRALPCALLLPAHGSPVARYHERIEELIRHHEQRLDLLRAACREPRTAADCVPILFSGNLPVHQYFFAIGESASHLVYLSEHGNLRIDGEFPWRFAMSMRGEAIP